MGPRAIEGVDILPLSEHIVHRADSAAKLREAIAGTVRDSLTRLASTGRRNTLPQHKVPAAIRFVPTLPMSATGKLKRHA